MTTSHNSASIKKIFQCYFSLGNYKITCNNQILLVSKVSCYLYQLGLIRNLYQVSKTRFGYRILIFDMLKSIAAKILYWNTKYSNSRKRKTINESNNKFYRRLCSIHKNNQAEIQYGKIKFNIQ